jgi:hypothetical protein
MSDPIYRQIYNTLNLKTTEELIEIWQTNDRVDWTDTAFDVIREILQERLGELPPQNDAIYEHGEGWLENETNEFEDEVNEKDLCNLENEPAFYEPRQVLKLETWLNWLAIAMVAISAILNLLDLGTWHQIIRSYYMNSSLWDLISWLIAFIIIGFYIMLQGLIYYFVLKALASILNILMEMEFNSRGAT